jgi:hypothetical protein
MREIPGSTVDSKAETDEKGRREACDRWGSEIEGRGASKRRMP